MNMFFRRRLMLSVKDDEITADSYIQNGLIFQLDGIDDGNTSGHWIEKKNQYDFELFNSPSKETYGYRFSGGAYGVVSDTDVITIPSTYSIEIVIKEYSQTGFALVFGVPTTNYGYIALNGSNYSKPSISFRPKTMGSNGYQINKTDLGSIHVSPSLGVQNKDVLTITSVTSHFSTGTNYTLCHSSYSGTFYICAIRVYNRELSQEEVIFNQNVDQKRFSL